MVVAALAPRNGPQPRGHFSGVSRRWQTRIAAGARLVAPRRDYCRTMRSVARSTATGLRRDSLRRRTGSARGWLDEPAATTPDDEHEDREQNVLTFLGS